MAPPSQPWEVAQFGGWREEQCGGTPATSAPSGREPFPCPLPTLEMPDVSATFPGLGNFLSQEPFLSRCTSRKAGPTAAVLPGVSLQGARARGLGPPHFPKVHEALGAQQAGLAAGLHNQSQGLHPTRKELPPKGNPKG